MSDMDKALALTHIVMRNFADEPCRCPRRDDGKHRPGCAPFEFLYERGAIIVGMQGDRERIIAEEWAGGAKPGVPVKRKQLPW